MGFLSSRLPALAVVLLASGSLPSVAWSQVDTAVPVAATAQADDSSHVPDTLTSSDSGAAVVIMQQADTVVVEFDSSIVSEKHRGDSPENRGFLIVASDGRSTLRFRGSIRINGGIDFKGLQEADFFDTYAIPVGDSSSTQPRFFMSARQTRLGIEAHRHTRMGDVFMRIEADFRGDPNTLRLRHAYASLRYLLMGQTWTVFMDPIAQPLTVDFDGPNSAISRRTVQIRYGRDVGSHLRWMLAVESPEPDVTDTSSFGSKLGFQSYPDLAGRLKLKSSAGHIQVAGIVRSIVVLDASDRLEYLNSWGLLGSARLNITDHTEFHVQIEHGEGISSFITVLDGRGLDALVNPSTGTFELLQVFGSFFSLGRRWSDRTQTWLTLGFTEITNKEFQPADDFRSSLYVSGNIFWDATEGSRFGLEYSFGNRVNKDGASGDASRLSFIGMYDF